MGGGWPRVGITVCYCGVVGALAGIGTGVLPSVDEALRTMDRDRQFEPGSRVRITVEYQRLIITPL